MDNQPPATGSTVFFSFDVEARGYSPMRHGVNAIGACVAGADGKVFQKWFWALKELPGQAFEQRCLDEFWLGSTGTRAVLAMIKQEAVPAAQAMDGFYNALAELNSRYKVVTVCDAPFYDVPMLSYYLDYFGYPPLFFKPAAGFARDPTAQVSFDMLSAADRARTPAAGFNVVVDALAYGTGADKHCIQCSGRRYNKDAFVKNIGVNTDGVAYDHNPTNDAEYNLRLFFAGCNVICKKHE